MDGRASPAAGRGRLLGNRSVRLGAALVGALVAFTLLAPLAGTHGPDEIDFVRGVSPGGTPVGPSAGFPLGADWLFRDELVRLAYAGRLSLLIAVFATALASALGALAGIASGWYEGKRLPVPWPAFAGVSGAFAAVALGQRAIALLALVAGGALAWRVRRGPRVDVDGWLMRFADVLLAFPFLLLVMAIGAAFDRTTAITIFVTLGATGWVGIARVLRAKTMEVRGLEYVEAARALGQSTPRVLVMHVLPNVAGPLVVTATVQVAQMILADAVLSYLGVGISPPTPTLGRMLFESQEDYLVAPWLVAAPATAIVFAVLGFNLLGEGLRDALDPREA